MWHTHCRRVALTLLTAVLQACASINGFPEPPTQTTSKYPEADYLLGADAIAKYNGENDENKKRTLRNEIIDARMGEIDKEFALYERALHSQGVGTGVGTQWAVLALSAASSLSRVTNTKTIYSTLSTAVTGGSAAFNKEVLFDKTMPVLMAQMQAEREGRRAAIRAKQDLPVARYSWYAAESDIQNFAFAGSIPGALNAVAKDAGKKTVDAEAEMKSLTHGTYSASDTTALLKSFWRPGGAVNADNEKELLVWLKKNNFDTSPGSIPMFIYSAETEAAKSQAVTDLKLPRK